MRKRYRMAGAGVLALALVAAACGGDDDDDAGGTTPAATAGTTGGTAAGGDVTVDTSTAGLPGGTAGPEVPMPVDCEIPDPVTLQLQWFIQSQFAGYYAAQAMGFYNNVCISLQIAEGGVDIVPQQQLADGAADFAIAWVPKALQTREQGANIVDIAQMFTRSGTLQVSFKDKGITTPADFAGKTLGNWGFGNEYEIFAALAQADLDPATDVTLAQQQFDMKALLDGDIDAAEAMVYNEYAQVLEATDPATGELYTPEDFNLVSYEDVGVGMLQDAVWADGDKLANDPDYVSIATRFLAASIAGWMYCSDHAKSCRDIVVDAGSQLGASHQLWQMNEVNKLIWPNKLGIGTIDPAAWDRTVEIAQKTPNLEGTTVLTAPPTDGAYTNEIVKAAYELLGGLGVNGDVRGTDFKPIDVTLEAGGS